VVASDLEEEAPIYWLRVKQAAQRGAKLIVVNPRPTKLDRYASHILRYPYGAEAAMMLALVNAYRPSVPSCPKRRAPWLVLVISKRLRKLLPKLSPL